MVIFTVLFPAMWVEPLEVIGRIFGDAVFNATVFGGTAAPMIRIPVQGSGTSNNFTVVTEDTKAPYKINGLYIDFIPSGRR